MKHSVVPSRPISGTLQDNIDELRALIRNNQRYSASSTGHHYLYQTYPGSDFDAGRLY